MDKITVSYASIPSREKELVKSINSVIDQVDQVNICLNNYKHNPYEHKKVNVIYSDNSLADAGRYLFPSKGYQFFLDDDLIVDENYIQDTIKRMTTKSLYTYHGRCYDSFPIVNYHKSPIKKYRCLNDVEEDVVVDIGGSGCMSWHSDYFEVPVDILVYPKMADVLISCYAKKRDIPIICLSHKEGYFKYQHVKNTIYEERVNNCEKETSILNDYFK